MVVAFRTAIAVLLQFVSMDERRSQWVHLSQPAIAVFFSRGNLYFGLLPRKQSHLYPFLFK